MNINGIICESYIILKINKSGNYNILFNGNVKPTNKFCYGVSMHIPTSMTINEKIINPPINQYQFTEQQNTIKLVYPDSKEKYNCLFLGCSGIDEIDASHLITSNVNDMEYMFHQCSSLTSLIISNFNTEKVLDMRSMFGYCSSLTSIDVSHFKTPLLEDMAYLFEGCSKLSSIYLLNFDTSNVLYMDRLFNGCSSLTTLDISNFKTSKVTWTSEMFRDCYLLTTLDLSNFDTSSVKYFMRMFDSCKSLISLDLSNFHTESAINMYGMFKVCSNLKYINLNSLIINEDINYTSLIDNNLINPIICIDDKQSFNKIISLYKCRHLNNPENWGEYKDKISYGDNIYINDCLLSKYDINCYQICTFYYYDENINKYLCTENLKCVEPYDKLIYGKNECIESCSETKNNKYEFVLEKICLTNCPENFYEPKDKPFSCIPKCPIIRPFLFFETLECVSHCTIKQRQNKLCKTYYIYSKETNYKIFDEVISQTRDELLNNYDPSVVDGGIINENGDNITITRTQQNDNNNNDGIYLGECEDRLKKFYNIPENEKLYVLRLDIRQIGLQIPMLEYEILYPIYDNKNLVKLNLTIYSDIKLNRTIKANLTGNIDKYNKKSNYYNDICYITDSDYGTDISLSDRKEEYINNNMGICEDKCDFISYNYETQKAVCSCNIKTEISLMKNINLDKKTLLNSFLNINNIANIQMLKCYKVVFLENNIFKNIGFLIYAILFIFNLICFLYFILKDYKIFKLKIYKLKIFFQINEKKNKNIPLSIYRNNKKANDYKDIICRKSSERKFEINNINNKKKINTKKQLNKIYSPPKYNYKDISNKKRKIINNNKIIINTKKIYSDKKLMNHNISSNKGFIKKEKNIKLNYNEMNHLSFKNALTRDKRTFIQYYVSLIRSNHLILYIFYSNDYNSRAIKLSIFIFNVSSSIAINSLFFNDSTMHKIYNEHGSFDLLYQLPQIIYSTLISNILNFLINILGLTEKNILKIKNSFISSKDVHRKFNILLRMIRIKFIFFFIINFILSIIFWYYVTCFCGIYRNTQKHLFKDSLFSFITALIVPFILYLIPGVFRICALKRKNKVLYGFSKILQTL